MVASALPFWARFAAPAQRPADRARTAPPPAPRPGPIFIHDAITPYRGETLLSAMLRAELKDGPDDPSS